MKKIILTGGGTAGHVTPNIALLPRLKELGYDISYIGSYAGMEKGLIEQQDACEGLVVAAVIEGSYKKALQVFTLNRTIPSANVAKEILDEMIEANKEYCVELK